ncbi:response regulator [Novosphingobium decolorationis]|uniref:histidine kinase n=1 Tax=Novosphingobium decolorationis TaxID=2698673 RepID=A0ABX8E9C6_9SPHN|nr:response regulator [Novosphingobium decolorationis]QVM85713.1 response regulator [Novosphingobium decolorationis]
MAFARALDSRPLLYTLLAALLLLTAIVDSTFPLGMAFWVIYLIPTTLAFLSPHRIVPAVVAVLACVLIVVGFVLAPENSSDDFALVNRTLACITNLLIGGMGVAFIAMRNATRFEQHLRQAETDLARALQGNLSLEDLGTRVLNFLGNTFGATAGLLYVNDDGIYRRTASYAVPENAAVPAVIERGDGLLGETINHGKARAITRIPEGYIAFGSALGQARPDRLVIGASTIDGRVNGLIEVAFLDEPGTLAHEVPDFLERISGILGVALRAAKYRARLEHLLSETQQQAEEMQNQSEELRATNDELEAQTKLLQSSQEQLEAQQADLERSNAQLEEQTASLEAQRDELTRAQTRMRAQAEELEQASRYKSEFLANMSHELRTPLNSLLIMARLLADNRGGNLNEEQVRYAQTIETSGNDLLTLINDVLDISKIEAGRIDLEARELPVEVLLAKLRDSFASAAADKRLALRITQSDDAPRNFETDPLRFEQIIKNFLSNAIKFTEKGEVALEVTKAPGDALAFTVRDTGPGIPEDQREAIFEAFRQADGGIARKYGGTGLGLSISRELASLLGGAITLESTQGEGSAFTLTVPRTFQPSETGPASRPASSTSEERSARSGSIGSAPHLPAASTTPFVPDDRENLTGDSRTILIVEDDPAFARILLDIAHETGFQCLVAGTADEGALLARQYLPQAVILDMHLPDHTGLSVLDRIKRDTRTRHIPVHIVSADHDDHDALASGAVGYLFKPVARETLVTMLEGLEARMAQRLRRVLVVEDDSTQADAIHQLLASRDVETVTVQSAAGCLERLASDTFDCMVLDLNLPDMTGLDLLDRLSHDESVSFPPVIVYTGRDLSSEEEMRLRRYSKSIIIKGAKSPERLLDEVTLFLHQVVSDLPDEKQQLLARSLGRDAALEGRQILVVEDDIRNVYALTSVLEPHGVNVRIARNGLEALSELARAADSDGAPVDLVLMDIMMPEMDGLTCMREIRKQGEWTNLPIIALTAKAMERDHRECLEAGANDYLPKPLDIDKLLSLVRVWMPRR